MLLKEDLIKRWEETGRIGLEKVRSPKRAMELIDTISQLYEDEQCNKSENIVNLKDLAEQLRDFILN